VTGPAAAPVTIGAACTACGVCVATCPTRALHRAPQRPVVLAARCTGCLACLEVCPAGAVEETGR
jgi:electron transport complex protein RnfB